MVFSVYDTLLGLFTQFPILIPLLNHLSVELAIFIAHRNVGVAGGLLTRLTWAHLEIFVIKMSSLAGVLLATVMDKVSAVAILRDDVRVADVLFFDLSIFGGVFGSLGQPVEGSRWDRMKVDPGAHLDVSVAEFILLVINDMLCRRVP